MRIRIRICKTEQWEKGIPFSHGLWRARRLCGSRMQRSGRDWSVGRTTRMQQTEQRTACHEKSWLVLLPQWYGWNGSGHLCPQRVPVQPEQRVSTAVCPQSPPARPQSASSPRLITPTYSPLFGQTCSEAETLFQTEWGTHTSGF